MRRRVLLTLIVIVHGWPVLLSSAARNLPEIKAISFLELGIGYERAGRDLKKSSGASLNPYMECRFGNEYSGEYATIALIGGQALVSFRA